MDDEDENPPMCIAGSIVNLLGEGLKGSRDFSHFKRHVIDAITNEVKTAVRENMDTIISEKGEIEGLKRELKKKEASAKREKTMYESLKKKFEGV